MISPLHALLSTLLLSTLVSGQEPTPEAHEQTAPTPAPIKQLNASTFQIGQVLLDRDTQTITVPATLNTLEKPLEYILVLEKGQSHESLLLTEILPFNLNVALKLLDFQTSQELFPILDKDYRPTDQFHPVTPEAKAASRLNLFLSIIQPDGTAKELPLNGLVLLTATLKPLPNTPWVYNGSYIHQGQFKADLKGNLISILQDTSALINCPLDNREGDRLWIANKKHLPATDTPVKLLIRPANQQ